MTTDVDSRATFTGAMVERYLAAAGFDPAAAAIAEAGLRTGRHRPSRPPDPRQQPERFYPGLTARPWHDERRFDWVDRLEAAFDDIRREALEQYRSDEFAVDEISGGLAEGRWREYRLFTEGEPVADHVAVCPRTAELVASIPGATTAGLVFFAALGPGTHVRPHWGPHNARLRCHLGLVVPPGCGLRVGGETREWQEGRALLFDDSFEHEVWNRGTGTRLVLIIDVWHPDLTPAQILAIRYADMPLIRTAYEVAAGWQRSGRIPRLSKTSH